MSTLRDKIFACDDLPKKSVVIPEWDVTVYVRMLSAAEMNSIIAVHGKDEYDWAHLLICAVVDEFGDAVFTEEDKAAIGKRNNKVVRRLLDEISTVNGFGAKEVSDLEEKFPK